MVVVPRFVECFLSGLELEQIPQAQLSLQIMDMEMSHDGLHYVLCDFECSHSGAEQS